MPKFTSLGYFIVDEFHYLDARGDPTGKQSRAQVRLTELFDTSILITYIPISHFICILRLGVVVLMQPSARVCGTSDFMLLEARS